MFLRLSTHQNVVYSFNCNTNLLCTCVVKKRRPVLGHDELTTVRKNLETQAFDVDNDFVRVNVIVSVWILFWLNLTLVKRLLLLLDAADFKFTS